MARSVTRNALIPFVLCTALPLAAPAAVETARVPGGGLQPQAAADPGGGLHLVYFKGEPAHGNVFYVRLAAGSGRFSRPIRVNSRDGSAVATGSMRGARLAVGEGGRVHVAWNGSGTARPKGLPDPRLPEDHPHRRSAPMLYARMNDAGDAFEPERNLMRASYALDGGGDVAADGAGGVWVAWHAGDPNGEPGEAGRAVWVAASSDGGKTFSTERRAGSASSGACGCCGLSAAAAGPGSLGILFRTAAGGTDRSMALLSSAGGGNEFGLTRVHSWTHNACPASSSSLNAGGGLLLAAWETGPQVYCAVLDPDRRAVVSPLAAPGTPEGRKHPRAARNAAGELLLVWNDGSGWGRGGDLAWCRFDRNGRPAEEGRIAGAVPAWSFGAPCALQNGDFLVLY